MKHNNMLEQIVELGIGLQFTQQLSSILPNICDSSGSSENEDSWNLYMSDGKIQAGPFSEKECCLLIDNEVLIEDSLIWMPKMSNWELAKNVPVINKLFLLKKK